VFLPDIIMPIVFRTKVSTLIAKLNHANRTTTPTFVWINTFPFVLLGIQIVKESIKWLFDPIKPNIIPT
jgi:hypothetical protein